jgi:hypothetical protein
LFELFQFKPETCNETCETLALLLKEGCPFEKSPTNVKHINGYLMQSVKLVKGITLNSNLYTRIAEDESSRTEQIEPLADDSSSVQIISSESSTLARRPLQKLEAFGYTKKPYQRRERSESEETEKPVRQSKS